MTETETRMTLTVKEAANALGVSLPILYTLAQQKDFPALRVGRKILIPADQFKSWLNSQSGQLLS